MAEDQEGDASSAALPDTGGLAQEMALAGASRAKADAFLEDQRNLIAIQKHHLGEQFKSLRLSIWEKRLGVLLRIATAFVGIAVATALAVLVWNASNSSDLIMDAFSVPPDLAANGQSGEVMAGEIAGRISDMLARYPNSARAPQSYANGSGSDIRIEIPQTGVSLSELDRFLRARLGRDIHITGAVVRMPTGLKLTVRAGALGSVSVEGPESELDSLQQRLAEAVFGLTQPYRYGVYLANANRWEDADVVLRKLSRVDDARERAWGYVGLGVGAASAEAARDYDLRALEQDPNNGLAMANLRNLEAVLGRDEQALVVARKLQALLARPDHGQIRADQVAQFRLLAESNIAAALGAFQDAAQKVASRDALGRSNGTGQSAGLASTQRRAHDLAAARATMVAPLEETPGRAANGAFANERERMRIAMAAEDWDEALKRAFAVQQLARVPRAVLGMHTATDPDIAFIFARVGRFAEAEKLVADMPGDCNRCLIARAQIAALQNQHDRADYWFAKAVADAPSIPFANYDWGRSLLARGQEDAAIAQFTLANQKGPHFADALQGWGEALMAKNQSHLALAKFAEAEKYAPNWGRLHLKWGQALAYAGKPEEAKAKFARAAQLDLTPSEKAELARVRQ